MCTVTCNCLRQHKSASLANDASFTMAGGGVSQFSSCHAEKSFPNTLFFNDNISIRKSKLIILWFCMGEKI